MFVRYVFQAGLGLALFDLLSLFGFVFVHRVIRRCRVAQRGPRAEAVPQICRAVEEACVWYPKQALCLQRSAVATWLLRRHGVPAQLVIGYRPVPIDSHAWVEVEGRIVNDRPQYQKFFRVLDRL